MRCLLILAHPRRDSLCGALFDAYAAGARQAGAQCRELILSELRFDPDVHALSPEQQPLEPDLARAQLTVRSPRRSVCRKGLRRGWPRCVCSSTR